MLNLNLTLVQAPLVWENIDANLERFDAWIDALDEPTDLIILPEMFSTGFSVASANLAESMQGKAVNWMRRKAAERNAVITGSLMITENQRCYNRLIWARPDGRLDAYDKRHLFPGGEDAICTAGRDLLTVELQGWKVRPFICYDLRFPVWNRNIDKAYDLAIYVANWPARRAAHWRILLQARAIENQVFVAAVNRVGQDSKGHHFSGFSTLIDPKGQRLFEQQDLACRPTLTLRREALTRYRDKFPAWMDADGDMVRIVEPQV